jgi:DUF971 family protein
MSETKMPAPIEIGRANLFDITVKWQDGHQSLYPARFLRLNCPCAACVDEVTGARRHSAVASDNVKPLGIQLVGNYAISIQWSDAHSTGIYAFDKLRKLCPCEQCKGSG